LEINNLMIEAMEETALVRAIREGETTETVSNQDVFDILESTA
jgi:hypothetical protein